MAEDLAQDLRIEAAEFALQTLLTTAHLVTNLTRVQRAIQTAAHDDPQLEAKLREACPTWLDPGCDCKELDTITDLLVVAGRAFDSLQGARNGQQ